MIDAEWGEVMDQTDSDADERAEKSTSLNDVYVYVSHKNGRFAGAMAGCSTMPPLVVELHAENISHRLRQFLCNVLSALGLHPLIALFYRRVEFAISDALC